MSNMPYHYGNHQPTLWHFSSSPEVSRRKSEVIAAGNVPAFSKHSPSIEAMGKEGIYQDLEPLIEDSILQALVEVNSKKANQEAAYTPEDILRLLSFTPVPSYTDYYNQMSTNGSYSRSNSSTC
eukprot:scpid102431/ scgid16923/ 